MKHAGQYIEALNQSSFWRLFVDGFKQRSDYDGVEGALEYKYGHLFWATREPTGLNKIRQAARKLFSKNLKADLTFEFIQELHKEAYPFEDYLRIDSNYVAKGNERRFGVVRDKKEATALYYRSDEIKNLINAKTPAWKIVRGETHNEILNHWTLKKKKAAYSKLYKNYTDKLKNEPQESIKLETIAQFFQDLECLHFFKDGNCRVVYLLLNKELIKNGFEPVILLNPNFFDNLILLELVDQIKDGQAAFARYIKTGLPYKQSIPQEEIEANIAELIKSKNALDICSSNDNSMKKYLHYTEIASLMFNKFAECAQKTEFQNIKSYQSSWNKYYQHFVVYVYGNDVLKMKKLGTADKFLGSKMYQPIAKHAISNETLACRAYNESIGDFGELLDFKHVLSYVTSLTKLKKEHLTIKNILKYTEQYFRELIGLENKYLNEYSLKTLANPEQCHLTIAEVKMLKTNEVIGDLVGGISSLDLIAKYLGKEGEDDLIEDEAVAVVGE